MQKLDWSDLQYLLAVAQHGTLAGAARALQVNHSTVLRRINTFEQSHAVRLFDRLRSGYRLTGEGQQLLEAAQRVEGLIEDLERKIAGKDLRLAGTVRLTTTDSFLLELLTPHLCAFHDAYPDIVVNVTVTNHVLSLTRRDADVAIRPGKAIPAPLAGAVVCGLNFALYASHDYWRNNSHRSLNEQSWLGLDDIMADAPPGRWLANNVPQDRIVFTADTFLALLRVAEHGQGVAVLPRFVGDASRQLVRVQELGEACRNNIMVLTHKDLMHTARIKTFTDFMIDTLRGETKRLLGSV